MGMSQRGSFCVCDRIESLPCVCSVCQGTYHIVTHHYSPSTEPSVPDGVDPSFLAALPDSIRQEVIAEQLRLQRIRQRAQQQQQQAQSLGITEVNPEFLAALPPSIQEEV